MKKRLAILGSTGSIGTQTLDIVREHPEKFEAYTLTAGSNADLLIAQARAFHPESVVIADEGKYNYVREALADTDTKVYAGEEALCGVVENEHVDIVVTAMVGFAGLRPTVHALRAHKLIALANKETLVVAGTIITALSQQHRAPILPVDSEHSAIFQCLAGEAGNAIDRILLTASGGPFRCSSDEELAAVTPAQALKHPNWAMGAKITIDSATMMNKGFEMIEACHLFGCTPEQVQVVVHPESVIHSAVQFRDGSVKAQLGVPDMRLPIAYALSYPKRLPLSGERLDLFALGALTFTPPSLDRFRCLALAYEAIRRGGSLPCVLNAANEVANLAFRQEKIGFTHIATVIETAMARAQYLATPTLDDLFALDAEARCIATEALATCR